MASLAINESDSDGGDDSANDDHAAVIPTGLGHPGLQDMYEPLPLAAELFSSTPVGRCRRIPREHALAFAMVTHERVGQGSVFAGLLGELVQRVVVSAWPREARVPLLEGALRLMGGGDLL